MSELTYQGMDLTAVKLDFNDAQFLSVLLFEYMKAHELTENGHLKNLYFQLKAGC